jgi:hypothetical protein
MPLQPWTHGDEARPTGISNDPEVTDVGSLVVMNLVVGQLVWIQHKDGTKTLMCVTVSDLDNSTWSADIKGVDGRHADEQTPVVQV